MAKDTYRLKVREWKKIISCQWTSRKAGIAILISDIIGFKMKVIKKGKERHYLMVKGSIQEEDIIVINIYVPNIGSHSTYKNKY